MSKPAFFSKVRSWSKKKKILTGLLSLITLLIVYFLLPIGADNGPPTVLTNPLTKGNITDSLLLKAPLEGSEIAEVVSRLHYEILALHVKEGDRVTKGQVLAVLDREKLQTEVDKAADSLTLLRAQSEERLKNNQLAYEQAFEALTSAERSYERIKSLYDSGAESLTALEAVEREMQDAKRKINEFYVTEGVVVLSASEQKQLDIAAKDLTYKQQDLSEAEIKSPIDGTITRVNVKVGRFADDTDDDKPMFIIENLAQLQMNVRVSEFDISKVKIGQEVNVTADILQGDSIGAIVERISPTGELKDNTSTERVIPIQIKLIEKDERLIAGINARAEIILDQAADVFLVSHTALCQNENGDDQIAVITASNTIHWIPVTIGLENDLEIAVQSNELNEGMSVIQTPSLSMIEGTPIISQSQP